MGYRTLLGNTPTNRSSLANQDRMSASHLIRFYLVLGPGYICSCWIAGASLVSSKKSPCVSHPLIGFPFFKAGRKNEQVCSPGRYQRVFDRPNNLRSDVEHLVIQVGIPIAYPRMVFLDMALENKFTPLVAKLLMVECRGFKMSFFFC